MDTMKGDTAVAGPTGVPWVNSNAWFSLLAAELAPGKTVWLDFDPPDDATVAHPASYPLAIADSEVYGSRWILSLDDKFRGALLKGVPQATAMWTKANETLTFFTSHPQWRGYKAQGILTVISDFSGDNGFISGETMNLLNRRHIQFKVMERSKALLVPMPGEKALLWLDKDAPTTEQTAKALAFVRQGGLLIAPTYWGPAGVKPTRRDPSIAYQVYNVGQGQMAVPDEGFRGPVPGGAGHATAGKPEERFGAPVQPGDDERPLQLRSRCASGGLVQIVNYSTAPAELRHSLGEYAGARRPFLEFRNIESHRPSKVCTPHPERISGCPTITVNCGLEIEV